WFGSCWDSYKAPFGWSLEMDRQEFVNGSFRVVKAMKDPFSPTDLFTQDDCFSFWTPVKGHFVWVFYRQPIQDGEAFQ
ncbi:unnamed protein product, partial [Symbiodinium sp. CCMP2592]